MTTAPLRGDTIYQLWAKLLTKIQQEPTAIAHNNYQRGDTLRQIKKKILRACNGV